MLTNVAIAMVMIIITTLIHASAMMLAMRMIYPKRAILQDRLRKTRVFRVSGVVILMFGASLLEVVLWAVPYLFFKSIEGFEKATYFSIVTYTTLGYWDILLEEKW